MKLYAKSVITLAGVCLWGALPQVVVAQNEASSLYVEEGDKLLLFDGQLPPGSAKSDNPFSKRIGAALAAYEAEWLGLPNIDIAFGKTLKPGSIGPRVALVRKRLGLSDGDEFDAKMAKRVRLFRQMHGLSNGNQIDRDMVAALARGAGHYQRILKRNLAHADELPAYLGYRYVHVDLSNQRLQMIEDGVVIDEMAVVAGKASTPTPIMAGLLRHAVLSPYWNVPSDLVRDRYARRIIRGGDAYLAGAGFEVLTDYTDDARVIPASTVDWVAVERGEVGVRLRQKPGPGNGMGKVKFTFPNALGIYLHDTPSKHLFKETERLFSAGCVRVERPNDLGAWLFNGAMPAASGAREEVVSLPYPVPVYITYFTAQPDASGASHKITFRDDFYRHDAPKLSARSLD